jgi:hypothetical protein
MFQNYIRSYLEFIPGGLAQSAQEDPPHQVVKSAFA